MTVRQVAPVGALAAMAVLGTVAPASAAVPNAGIPVAAQSAAKCSRQQSKEFDTPGFNVDIKIKVCVRKYHAGEYYSYVKGSWNDGGGLRKFDKFRFYVRIEHHGRTAGKSSNSLAGEINNRDSGKFKSLEAVARGKAGGWTGDAYIRYNIDSDGKTKTWRLHGSPKIR